MENGGKYFETDFTDDYRLMLLSDGGLRTEDGQIFHVHKFVLAKKSKYFYALFCGMGRGKKDVLIPGIKGKVLSSILSYIYTDNIDMTGESVGELMVASDYLMLDDLLSRIKAILRNSLSIVNCLSVFLAALKINREDILLESYRFVQTHFEDVVHSNDTEFDELPLGALKQLLGDRSLRVSSERTVFLAIIRWIEADFFNRLHWMPDLLMHLMVADVDEELATEIVRDTIAKNPFCNDITDIKLSLPNASNLEIIRAAYSCRQQRHSEPVTSTRAHRLPAKLNCIAHYCSFDGIDGIRIYLTYDEKIDLWRKILDIDFSPTFLICIGNCIYMLKTSENKNYYYDIVGNRWHEMSDLTVARNDYAVVQLEESIYILGGFSAFTGDEIYGVEVYDAVFDMWYFTSPMIPISFFAATTLNRSIYVLGYKLTMGVFEMIAQVYDAHSETWSLLPPGSIARSHFAVVAYLEKIYVLGGIREGEHLRAVEIYDPATKEWTREPDLPHLYYFPKAIVFHDRLVIYDNHFKDRKYLKTNPPVFWNAHQRCWERFEESSPMNDLHLYQFLSIGNFRSINILSKENRDPDMVFDRSPFSQMN